MGVQISLCISNQFLIKMLIESQMEVNNIISSSLISWTPDGQIPTFLFLYNVCWIAKSFIFSTWSMKVFASTNVVTYSILKMTWSGQKRNLQIGSKGTSSIYCNDLLVLNIRSRYMHSVFRNCFNFRGYVFPVFKCLRAFGKKMTCFREKNAKINSLFFHEILKKNLPK